ncbi:hypothetical protein ACSQ67_003476 [Phaseolus vulgaris]
MRKLREFKLSHFFNYQPYFPQKIMGWKMVLSRLKKYKEGLSLMEQSSFGRSNYVEHLLVKSLYVRCIGSSKE